MGYVAIKGGERAIAEAARAMEFARTGDGAADPLSLPQIETQLRWLHSRVLSEGGLYSPELASLAIKQCGGDPLEAAFTLRAHRSTRPRLLETPAFDTREMRLIRRISSAFKEIPGGQRLGPTPDYLLRLFRFELLDESPEAFRAAGGDWLRDVSASGTPETLGKVLDALRAEGLVAPPDPAERARVPFDITRQPLVFPVPRSAQLAVMARGETGGLLALAYSTMRGYGDTHPTIAELRVGYLPIRLPHPVTGEPQEIGEVLMTECEVVAMWEPSEDGAKPSFSLGYGACFGHNEVKAIAMAILDRALQHGRQHGVSAPAEDPEFVLLHVDGVDSMGFTTHWKLPHYVTFQSYLDRLRTTRRRHGEERA